MIALATGTPTAKWNGAHVVLSVPSGEDTIEIALSLRDGELCYRAITEACREGFVARVTESARVMPFKEKRGRNG
jgi:hypothetical protein